MIPVQPRDEPPDFNAKVRARGVSFLARVARPVIWDNHEYWRDALDDLRAAYGSICSYLAHWIPRAAAYATVDHYLPKSRHPHLAYEWNNYRLACAPMNAKKRDHEDVIDPFLVQHGWFVLDFPSLQVAPGPGLDAEVRAQVAATISRLCLNEESAVQDRLHWLEACAACCRLSFLRRNAPFLAYELVRQGLVNSIADIMKLPTDV